MTSQKIQDKGILAKLLEKGIKILIRNECNRIGSIQINIYASSLQIIKGLIKKIYIIGKNINYKDLLFDKIELEANEVKINLKLINKELKFKNDFSTNFTISLSEESLKKTLLSNNWKWIGSMISKEILSQDKLEDIKIKNSQILIKASKDNNTIEEANIDIKILNGKIYLKSKKYNKTFMIPIEDKIYVKNIIIHNNLIVISAISSISF